MHTHSRQRVCGCRHSCNVPNVVLKDCWSMHYTARQRTQPHKPQTSDQTCTHHCHSSAQGMQQVVCSIQQLDAGWGCLQTQDPGRVSVAYLLPGLHVFYGTEQQGCSMWEFVACTGRPHHCDSRCQRALLHMHTPPECRLASLLSVLGAHTSGMSGSSIWAASKRSCIKLCHCCSSTSSTAPACGRPLCLLRCFSCCSC